MIIFYRGQDIYRLRTALATLRARLANTHATLTDSGICDVRERDGLTELEHALKYPSLFQQTSFIVARNVLADADTAQSFKRLLESYEVSTNADLYVVACHEGAPGRESAAAKALTTYLHTSATEQESFDPLQGPALTAWISDFCAAQHCRISTEALALLATHTTGDSWALAMELSKLCAFGQSNGEVDLTAVQQLVAAPQESDAWELSNALSRMDKRGAIVALFKKLNEGTSEHLLMGSLAASIRTLMAIRDLVGRNMPTAAIAKATGLHPYVISKSLAGAKTSDPVRLSETHASLARLDRQSKQGMADTTDALFSILLAL